MSKSKQNILTKTKLKQLSIASKTAIKIKAIERLLDKGVTDVRTDNEENNPMYKINVALGFTPEPYCYDYQREI